MCCAFHQCYDSVLAEIKRMNSNRRRYWKIQTLQFLQQADRPFVIPANDDAVRNVNQLVHAL